MRYHVTLWTAAFELVTYDVEAASEGEAGTIAADRHLEVRPELGERDVTVCKVVGVGSYVARPLSGAVPASDQPEAG